MDTRCGLDTEQVIWFLAIANGRHGHAQRGGELGLDEFGFGSDRLDVQPGRALGGVAFGIGDGIGQGCRALRFAAAHP